MQQEFEKKSKETQDILEAADTLEKESNKNAQLYQNLYSEFQEQKEYYETQLSGLEEENKRLLDTLIRHSKGKASGQTSYGTSQFQSI